VGGGWQHRSVSKAFVQACAEQLKAFFPAGAQKSPDFGRIITRSHTERLAHLLSQHNKADVVCGGAVDIDQRFVEPTVVKVEKKSGAAAAGSGLMSAEIFGPILPVLEFDTLEEVIGYVNAHPKPLALYLFTSDKTTIDVCWLSLLLFWTFVFALFSSHPPSTHPLQAVTTKTSSGGISVNDVMMHFANPSLPFGGVGASGVGSYHHIHGFRTFSHAKPILHKSRYALGFVCNG
jgi:aldehyde dehydrogenase (NAD+)